LLGRKRRNIMLSVLRKLVLPVVAVALLLVAANRSQAALPYPGYASPYYASTPSYAFTPYYRGYSGASYGSYSTPYSGYYNVPSYNSSMPGYGYRYSYPAYSYPYYPSYSYYAY
jgi:hypothetical protein